MEQQRVRIFVDFWNFQLGWNSFHIARGREKGDCRIPWEEKLTDVLVPKANPKGIYVGAHVYASINPNSPADRQLGKFLHVMDGFPGFDVIVKERRPASRVTCSKCRTEITSCTKCGNVLKRTVEKGIDTLLLTDLIKASFNDTFDQAILITEDSDFIPAVEFIQERWAKQIIHAYFRGRSDALRNACWKHIFIDDVMDELLPGLALPRAPVASH